MPNNSPNTLQNRLYYVTLYPHPNYGRHFIVVAKSPKDAVARINWDARTALKINLLKEPADTYHHRAQLKHIITATRRYKRSHHEKFGWSHPAPVCVITELLMERAYEGHISVVAMQFNGRSGSDPVNILPTVPITV